MFSLIKILGLGGYSEPRGVRAEFCDHCLAIGPHWVYAVEEGSNSAKSGERPEGFDSYQLCQICSAKSFLPPQIIVASRTVAKELNIDDLISRTNPELSEDASIERIQTQLEQFKFEETRKVSAMTAFAYSQHDLASDMFRLADIRIWGTLFVFMPPSFKFLPKLGPRLLICISIGAVLMALYRYLIVPRRVRAILEPAWIRLLTGSEIKFSELTSFVESQKGNFRKTFWLLRSPTISGLQDRLHLDKSPAALRPGIDFLPPPKSRPGGSQIKFH